MKRIITYALLAVCATATSLADGPDRDFEGLRGPVKSVKTTQYFAFTENGSSVTPHGESTSYTTAFDREGYYTGVESDGVTRDDADRIVRRGEVDTWAVFYAWKGGRVERAYNPYSDFDGAFSTAYTYDADGRLASERTTGSMEDNTITYRYLEFDDHGNWTRRIVTKSYDDCTDGEEADEDSPEEDTCVETIYVTRTITYY